MSANELQACLARLYTSASFRRLVALEPDRSLEGYFLTPAERRTIAMINADGLERFAASLEVKRRRRLERAYPALFALNHAAIDTFCRRYHELYPRRPDETSDAEVIQFGTFIAETLVDGEQLPSYAVDLAHFERLMAQSRLGVSGHGQDSEASEGPRRRAGVVVARFRCNVSEIDDALRAGREPEVRDDEEFIVCGRRGGEREPRILRVSAAVALVVELCDGERSPAELVSAVEAHFGEPVLASAVDDILRQLADAQILEAAHGAAA